MFFATSKAIDLLCRSKPLEGTMVLPGQVLGFHGRAARGTRKSENLNEHLRSLHYAHSCGLCRVHQRDGGTQPLAVREQHGAFPLVQGKEDI